MLTDTWMLYQLHIKLDNSIYMVNKSNCIDLWVRTMCRIETLNMYNTSAN